jgi:hypothetical protein
MFFAAPTSFSARPYAILAASTVAAVVVYAFYFFVMPRVVVGVAAQTAPMPPTYCYGVLSTDVNVCSGNGQCVAQDTCQCDAKWDGAACSRYAFCNGYQANNPAVCSGHGTCVKDETCQCNPTYGGQYCGSSATCNGLAATDPSVCGYHGTCVSNEVCQCADGWSGQYCQYYKFSCAGFNPFSSFACSGHGSCVAQDTCQCNYPYYGSNCQYQYTCQPACINGQCGPGNVCQCQRGYGPADGCMSVQTCFGIAGTDPSSCYGIDYMQGGYRGNCTAADTCSCNPGWIAAAECSAWYAQCNPSCDNGICVVANHPNPLPTYAMTGTCSCDYGWTGADCTQLVQCDGIDWNDPSVCSGIGQCNPNNGQCMCPNGYAGSSCQTHFTCYGYEASDWNACHEGWCYAQDTCVCDGNWYGTQCQYQHPRCYGYNADDVSNVCSGHGTCIGEDTCQCNPGWHGSQCTIGPYTCYGYLETDARVCSGHGGCLSDGTCRCVQGFEGQQCQTEIWCNGYKWSDSKVCNDQQGKCTSTNVCTCNDPTNWGGSNCNAGSCIVTNNASKVDERTYFGSIGSALAKCKAYPVSNIVVERGAVLTETVAFRAPPNSITDPSLGVVRQITALNVVAQTTGTGAAPIVYGKGHTLPVKTSDQNYLITVYISGLQFISNGLQYGDASVSLVQGATDIARVQINACTFVATPQASTADALTADMLLSGDAARAPTANHHVAIAQNPGNNDIYLTGNAFVGSLLEPVTVLSANGWNGMVHVVGNTFSGGMSGMAYLKGVLRAEVTGNTCTKLCGMLTTDSNAADGILSVSLRNNEASVNPGAQYANKIYLVIGDNTLSVSDPASQTLAPLVVAGQPGYGTRLMAGVWINGLDEVYATSVLSTRPTPASAIAALSVTSGNAVSGFPVGIRFTVTNNATLDAMVEPAGWTPLYRDGKRAMRELLRVSGMGYQGTSYDVKNGSSITDWALGMSNACNDLCVPLSLNGYVPPPDRCEISKEFNAQSSPFYGLFQFSTISEALRACPQSPMRLRLLHLSAANKVDGGQWSVHREDVHDFAVLMSGAAVAVIVESEANYDYPTGDPRRYVVLAGSHTVASAASLAQQPLGQLLSFQSVNLHPSPDADAPILSTVSGNAKGVVFRNVTFSVGAQLGLDASRMPSTLAAAETNFKRTASLVSLQSLGHKTDFAMDMSTSVRGAHPDVVSALIDVSGAAAVGIDTVAVASADRWALKLTDANAVSVKSLTVDSCGSSASTTSPPPACVYVAITASPSYNASSAVTLKGNSVAASAAEKSVAGTPVAGTGEYYAGLHVQMPESWYPLPRAFCEQSVSANAVSSAGVGIKVRESATLATGSNKRKYYYAAEDYPLALNETWRAENIATAEVETLARCVSLANPSISGSLLHDVVVSQPDAEVTADPVATRERYCDAGCSGLSVSYLLRWMWIVAASAGAAGVCWLACCGGMSWAVGLAGRTGRQDRAEAMQMQARNSARARSVAATLKTAVDAKNAKERHDAERYVRMLPAADFAPRNGAKRSAPSGIKAIVQPASPHDAAVPIAAAVQQFRKRAGITVENSSSNNNEDEQEEERVRN